MDNTTDEPHHRVNEKTIYGNVDISTFAPGLYKEIFRNNFDFIRARILENKTRGYLIFASLRKQRTPEFLSVGEPAIVRDVIVGRHENCDIHLADDSSLSLRHLLLRFYGTKTEDCGCVRILDLNTSAGFFDKSNTKVAGLTSNGTVFLRASQSYLFIIRVEGNEENYDTFDAMWSSLPEQSIKEDLDTDSSDTRISITVRPRLKLLSNSESRAISCITRVPGPTHYEIPDLGDRRIFGFLFTDSNRGELTINLSAEQLSKGILIGRYPRCEIADEKITMSKNISRVHAMLLLDLTGLWIIDIASTNKTRVNDLLYNSFKIEKTTKFVLGGEKEFRWIFS
ncbi:MAG: FHA domain-containing protein [Deltaproteobacteria bacterium]|nr:FHA domain-containing protein [Deltaproteobacteria bacterium]